MKTVAYLICLCAIITTTLALSKEEQLITRKTIIPLPNTQHALQCCSGMDLLHPECRKTDVLNCEHGSYLLDPYVEAMDEFTILEDGSMDLKNAPLTPRSIYCIGTLDLNDTLSRYVARVCFEHQDEQSMITFKGFLSLISVAFLGVTLYVYNQIVMRDTQDRVVRIAVACLMGFFLVLGAVQVMSDLLMYFKICAVSGEWTSDLILIRLTCFNNSFPFVQPSLSTSW